MKKIALLIVFFNLWYLVGCSKSEDTSTQPNFIATAKNEMEEAIARERGEEYLRQHGIDVTNKNKALFYWIARGDLDTVSALLAVGADPISSGEDGITPLMEACFFGGDVLKQRDPGIVRLLLEAGADPNAVDQEGVTALLLAINYAQYETIPLLLQAGANPNIKNDAGKTPLHYSRESNIVRALLEAGAEPNTRDSEGQTPLLSMLSYLNNNSHFYDPVYGEPKYRADAKELITLFPIKKETHPCNLLGT